MVFHCHNGIRAVQVVQEHDTWERAVPDPGFVSLQASISSA